MAVVAAIDVGSGNTKWAWGSSPKEVRAAHFPSLAWPTDQDEFWDPARGKRRTVGVPIDELVYEVGPEVNLAADIFHATQVHERYTDTPEYLALLRGALYYLRHEVIDLLVVGLPVAAMKAKRQSELERLACGEHRVGRRVIQVKRTLAVAQPHGALMYYGYVRNRLGEVQRERNLIVDAGARTFDWLVTDGMQIVLKQSHSVPRGMFDVQRVIAEGISRANRTQFRGFGLIDAALRGGKNPVIFQSEYDIARHLPLARKIPEQAVSELLHYVGDASDIKNIILVGGGAFFFRTSIREAFPKHKLYEVKEPLYANVLGFQIAGLLHGAEAEASE